SGLESVHDVIASAPHSGVIHINRESLLSCLHFQILFCFSRVGNPDSLLVVLKARVDALASMRQNDLNAILLPWSSASVSLSAALFITPNVIHFLPVLLVVLLAILFTLDWVAH